MLAEPRWTDLAIKADSHQVSAKLRRGVQGMFHYCPGCEEAHCLFDSWTHDANLDAPTYSPSFKHSMSGDDGRKWTCHYVLTAGVLNFCTDSDHGLAGQNVPLPDLPVHLLDDTPPA